MRHDGCCAARVAQAEPVGICWHSAPSGGGTADLIILRDAAALNAAINLQFARGDTQASWRPLIAREVPVGTLVLKSGDRFRDEKVLVIAARTPGAGGWSLEALASSEGPAVGLEDRVPDE